jgi:hypothetical protein
VFEKCLKIFRSFGPTIRVRLGAAARQTSKPGSPRARIFTAIIAIIRGGGNSSNKQSITNELLPEDISKTIYRNSVLNELCDMVQP